MTGAELIALAKKHPVSAGCGLFSVALAVAIYFRADEIPAAETELAQKSADDYEHNDVKQMQAAQRLQPGQAFKARRQIDD